MKTAGFLNLAALIAAATLVGLVGVLYPEGLRTLVAQVSLGLLALTVGLMFMLPAQLARDGGDAATLMTLGPSAKLYGMVLLLTLAAFGLALIGLERLAWAADLLAVGGFGVGLLLLRGTAQVVAAAQPAGPSRHSVWQGQLQASLGLVQDAALRRTLESLAEKCRYAASDVAGGTPQDAEIDRLIGELAQQLAGGGAAAALPSRIEGLLAQREAFLRAARSKA